MRFVNWAALVIVGFLAAACSSTAEAPDQPAQGLPVSVENQGGSMEGHTPRGFAGSGTGLFLGDNLNPSFPDGDGIQMWLTFDLPEGLSEPASAVLTSEILSVRGAPFDDLGSLSAEPVTYAEFGPALFDLSADGVAVPCERVGDTGLGCDVTALVADSIVAGESRVQFRLKFDTPGDSDGEADLALFFVTDSNTNEPGIFTLELR